MPDRRVDEIGLAKRELANDVRRNVRVAGFGEIAVGGAANEAGVARRVEPAARLAGRRDLYRLLRLLLAAVAAAAAVAPRSASASAAVAPAVAAILEVAAVAAIAAIAAVASSPRSSRSPRSSVAVAAIAAIAMRGCDRLGAVAGGALRRNRRPSSLRR